MSSDRPQGELRVLHLLPDLAMGGGQQVLIRHLRAMRGNGIEHHVVHFGTSTDLLPRFEEAGIRVHWIPYRGWLAWPGTFRALVSLARDLRIDLLHTNGTFVDKLNGQWLARRLRLPLVTTLHGMHPRSARPALRPRALLHWLSVALGRRLERFLDRRTVRTFIAVSDAVRDDWRDHLVRCRIPEDKVQVIYSGIPIEQFSRPDAESIARLRYEVGLGDEERVLIAVCRLHRGKNVHLLVPTMKLLSRDLPRSVLLVVGSGDEEAVLREEIRREGLEDRVRLLGQRTDVAGLLGVSELMLFPSGQEGFGLVALEALAAGRPVVSSPLPSLRKLAEQGAGIRFASDLSPESFAEAARELLQGDPTTLRELGARSRAIVARDWNVADSAARYAEVYRQAARSSP